MEITHSLENEILIFAIKGRLDAATAPMAEETIKEKLAENTDRLLFDLSALEYLRSSVLRVILNAIKEISRKSGRIVLCCLNGYVKEIFEVNRIKDTIIITDSVESGLKSLSCDFLTA